MSSAKTAVQEYWDRRPCGSNEPPRNVDRTEFFRTHAQIRYAREPEILPFAEFETWSERRVLEIGVGIGADYIRFLKAGANAIGLDLSRRSVELAQENAFNNRVSANLLSSDAEALPFPDDTFDLVYSWGVLHHSPDIERTICEAHRVLRPGGECRVMLYNRRSLVGLQAYARYGLGRGRPLASVSNLLSAHVESPGTKAFTTSDVRRLFSAFREAAINSVVSAYDVRFGRRRFASLWMRRLVPSTLGWFLLIRAVK